MATQLQVASSILDEVYTKIHEFPINDENASSYAAGIHKSIDLAEQMILNVPASDDANEQSARSYYLRGLLLFQVSKTQFAALDKKFYRGLLEQSIESYKKSISINPTSYLTFYNLGINYANLGNKTEAVQALQNAIVWAESSGDGDRVIQTQKMIAQIEADTAKPSGGCYIATACYGSYDHPDVLMFRRFRDESLLPTRVGRLFVSIYYKLSPSIADHLGHVKWLSSFIRKCFLEPLARKFR
ncbi:MAG: CFI-box-CTERM domain-containing protein [Armatimonadota bacterium]